MENHHFFIGDTSAQMVDFPASYVSLPDRSTEENSSINPQKVGFPTSIYFLSYNKKSESFSCRDFFLKHPPPKKKDK